MNPIINWFTQKSLSEQKVITITLLLIGLLLIYAFLYLPLTRENKTLTTRIQSYQQDLIAMQTMAQRIKALTPQQNPKQNKQLNSTRLMTFIEKSAQQQKLKITQIKPLDAQKLQINFNDILFNAAMRWLSSLQKQHPAIQVDKLSVRQQKNSLNLNLTLSY